MIDYLYDGTFEGLLTCVYHHYYGEKASKICKTSEYQTGLLSPYREIETDLSLFQKVYDAIDQKISAESLSNIYYIYLSNYPEKETLILEYLKYGFKAGWKTESAHSHPIVHEVQKYARRVTGEAHRFLGLVRFSDVGGVLYAGIEPDHAILELIADHFSDRYRNEKVIIHDKRRDKAIFLQEGQWYLGDFKLSEKLNLSASELYYQDLWKNYFRQIAIAERTNPRCQAQFMPKRYWKNLTEIK